ncbi:ABC transporter permease [Marasmitruncus massiliensis]|uniref:ABC transporter permease n=1 Tax=Marasmitruncus massiliensis TaxID=1944642 RepID=UPI000C7B881C|nr:ABC transporter permease [Marasmitruncus massiliensis]MBE6907820.1 ABC transporter permease [Oscillospiraceae bacterium]
MSRRKINLKDFMMKLGPLMALFFLCAILTAVTSGRFLTYINLMNIFKQTSVNCLIASGMLVVLITAGIDLSVGSNCVLAACVVGVLVQNFGVKNPLVLIIAALVTGLLAGVANGLLLTRLNLPHPFISTLGMKNITLGLALLITSATPVGFFNTGIDPVLYLGSATIAGFPISFIVVVILFSGFHIFLNKTALGRQIYCVGGNPEAARLSGIRSKNVLTFVYGLSGFMCGIAAIVLIGRVSTANATAGTTFDTDAIAACIIGGASFNGGKGTIWGTLIGALIMGTIRNGLNLLGAQNDIQYIVIGAVIVLAVFIDVSRGRMEAKARRLAAM